MTGSRARRVRKARARCAAARLRSAFHNKHFHRWTFLYFLFVFLSPPTKVFVRGWRESSGTTGREMYLHPKRATCVTVFELPSSSSLFSCSASNQAETAPDSLRLPSHPDPATPSDAKKKKTQKEKRSVSQSVPPSIRPPYVVMAVRSSAFCSKKRPPPPRFCC